MERAVVQRTAPAAASTRAPGWLLGPPAPARVLAASALAAYLLPADAAAADAARDADVLALVGPDALRLPGAVLLPTPGDLAALRLSTGATVTVGDGTVQARGARLQVRRSWLPRRVPAGPWAAGGELAAVLHGIPLGAGREDLGRLAEGALRDPAAGVAALVGLGPGLTPSGDDVLCGMLLVLGALDPPAHGALAAAVRDALHRTTALSATLLRDALEGYAVPPVLDLLAAARRGPGAGPDLATLARAVTRVGHSSGSDLLVGVRTALTHLLAPAPSPRGLT